MRMSFEEELALYIEGMNDEERLRAEDRICSECERVNCSNCSIFGGKE